MEYALRKHVSRRHRWLMDYAPKLEEDTLEGRMDKGLKYLMLGMYHLIQVANAGKEVEAAREMVYTMECVFSHMQALYSNALYEIEWLKKLAEYKKLE